MHFTGKYLRIKTNDNAVIEGAKSILVQYYLSQIQ